MKNYSQDEVRIGDFAGLEKAFEENKYQLCITALKQVKVLLSHDPRRVALLARIAKAAGRSLLERVLWRWGVKNDPANIELLRGLGNAYQNRGRLLEAEQLIKRALDLAAGQAELAGNIWGDLATVYAQLRRFSSAQECLNKARDLSKEPEILYDQAFCALLEERFAEARQQLTELIALWNEPGPYMLLARLAGYDQNWPEAEQWLLAGLRHFPEYPWFWYFLAVNHWVEQKKEDFLTALERVENISPEADFLPPLYWLKANLFYQQGNWPELRQALNGGPQSKKTGLFMGKLAQKELSGSWDRVSLPLQPQIQLYNHCVPCSLSMILHYWGEKFSARELALLLMDGSGTPMDKVYSWLEEHDYALLTLRPGIEQFLTIPCAEKPSGNYSWSWGSLWSNLIWSSCRSRNCGQESCVLGFWKLLNSLLKPGRLLSS